MGCNMPIPALKMSNGDVKLMPFSTPDRVFLDQPGALLLPCRKCHGCKLSHAQQWRDRLMLELEETPGRKALFLTLTYRNDDLPVVLDDVRQPIAPTLDHRNVQLFLKRLRERVRPVLIRYFGCGEYGDKGGRPHYHLCIFGLDEKDVGPGVEVSRNELGQVVYSCKLFQETWTYGIHSYCNLTPEAMAYVARYTMKKLGDKASWYRDAGVKREYIFMSRRPGIGMTYFDKHPECVDLSSISISTADGGRQVHVPKAFLKRLELTDPAKYDMLTDRRAELAKNSLDVAMSMTDQSVLEEFLSRERVLKSKAKALKRR